MVYTQKIAPKNSLFLLVALGLISFNPQAHSALSCVAPASNALTQILNLSKDVSRLTNAPPVRGGKPSDRRFLASCKIESSGESFSGTLVRESQLVIAGHSEIDVSDPKLSVICRCGDTAEQGFSRVRPIDSVVHPEFIPADSKKKRPGSDAPTINLDTDESLERSFSDVQVVTLEKNALSACKGNLPTLAPIQIAPSFEKSKALIQFGECYLAGSGISDFRVVNAPKAATFGETSDKKHKTFLLLNSQTPAGMQYLIDTRIKEMKAAHLDQATIDQALRKAKIELEVKTIASKWDSAYGDSVYLEGDSGGSFICTDLETKVDYLVGVLTDGQQDVILLTDPKIKKWLDPLLKK